MNPRTGNTLADRLVTALCLTLVLFPKGGMRLAGIPLTWGYMLLFVVPVALLPYRFGWVRARFTTAQVVAFLCFVPFWLLVLYAVAAYGISDSAAMSGLFSTGVSLIVMPLLFLWFFPPLMPLVNGRRLLRTIAWCMLAAALFGIFLFFWKFATGTFIQIPYVTVNADDAADFNATKNISRGLLTKLISTYNNGNLYGAATIILLPLFDLFTAERWKRWIMRFALLLTLSRTVWAILIADQMLEVVMIFFRQRHTFPRLRLGRAAGALTILGISVAVLLVLVKLIGANFSFLADSSLGGRTTQFEHLGSTPWLPDQPSLFALAEVVYLSAINIFGRLGFPAISLLLLSPFVVLVVDRSALGDPIRRAAFRGLFLYALICTADGAIGLIPVMAFYSFAYMIFLFGLPGLGGQYPGSFPGRPSFLGASSNLPAHPDSIAVIPS